VKHSEFRVSSFEFQVAASPLQADCRLLIAFLQLICVIGVICGLSFCTRIGLTQDQTKPEPKPSPTQTPTPQDNRGLGVGSGAINVKQEQGKADSARPEIVLQAGISTPQAQISFSPDGRVLASLGMYGNSIKLWEVSSGRLLRQLESSTPSMGASSLTRPFRFSPDGKTVIAVADGRIRRWDVDSGRELPGAILPEAKSLIAVLLSEDGGTVAALNVVSQAVKLWDTKTGRELPAIKFADQEDIAADAPLALSPDGKLLAAFTETVKGSGKGLETRSQVTLWEVAGGRKTQTLKLPSRVTQFGVRGNQTASLAFSPDGQWLALRDESMIKVWDAASGRELKSFATSVVSADTTDVFLMFASRFQFSADHRLLSFVSDGNKINILDTASAATLQTLSGRAGNIVGLTFSADSKLFATSGSDNQITIWDVTSGRPLRAFSGAAMTVSDLAFSADGKTLVLAGPQGATVWELATGGVRRGVVLPAEYAEGRPGALLARSSLLSPDGKFLLAGSKLGGSMKVWEVASGRELPGMVLTPGKELANAAFSADGRTVALTDKNISRQTAKTLGAQSSAGQTASNTPAPPARNGVPDLSSMPGMPNLASMPDMSKMMEQIQKDPKKAQELIKKAQAAMAKGDLSAGMELMGQMGLTPPTMGGNKSTNSLHFFELASGKELQTIPLPGNFISQAAGDSALTGSTLSFSPDGRVIASASGFGAPVILRDGGSGQELRTLKTSNSMSVNSLAWSSDGKRLASAHWAINRDLTDPQAAEDFSFEDMKFSIRIWDATSGTELNSLTGHKNFVNVMAFSNDGQMLASGSFDSTIKLWDTSTGKELHTLNGHTGSITALRFSPDGQFVVSGSDDGSARLWSSRTGTLLATLVSLNKGSDWLVVTPEGLFDGSPGGWNQIMWRFTPNLFDVSSVEIFFNEYFRPGLLPDILAGRKLSAAVDISQKDRRQPKLTLERGDGSSDVGVSARALKVKVQIAEAPAGAQDVRLFRNGSLVKVWRGDVLHGVPNATLETTVSCVAGQNQFTAYAFNRDNVKSADAMLSLNGANTLKRPATLHLLVIGVNSYANPEYDLKFAAADARAFGAEVESQQRKLGQYQQIEVTSLLDHDATKANILYALERLAGSADSKTALKAPAELSPELTKALTAITPAEPEDAVVLYYAGHGTAQGQRFFLIPHDLGFAGKRTELDQAGLDLILTHSISDLELEQAFAEIDAATTLMVIDACNSGQALEAEEKRRGPMNSKGLAQLAYEKGMYILTAAQSYQAALEAAQLGHGYLTFALVEEGLKSAAADTEPQDNQVTLREWLDYATERVPRMQEEKMRASRGLGIAGSGLAFVEGEEKVKDVDKRSVQRPRVFYRREPEAQPVIVARP
jgi:WD40 repeat protein